MPPPHGPAQPTPAPSASPSPSPSASPTPTPSPSTVPCPPTLTIAAVGTPRLLSGTINNDALFPEITTNYDITCVVKDVKIAMRVTTATGFVSTPTDFTSPSANLGVCGAGVGFSGCGGSGLYGFNFNATGNQIGTTCGDFVFDTTATTVFNTASPPPPPYSGTYQWDPNRNGVEDQWRLKDLEYSFFNTFKHPPDTVLECARIDITTQIVP